MSSMTIVSVCRGMPSNLLILAVCIPSSKYQNTLSISSSLCRRVDDSIKTTRFIEYLLTLLHVRLGTCHHVRWYKNNNTQPNKMFLELCINNTNDFQNTQTPEPPP